MLNMVTGRISKLHSFVYPNPSINKLANIDDRLKKNGINAKILRITIDFK